MTNKDPRDDKIFALKICLFKLEKKTSILETFQGGGDNTTQFHTNTKERDPNKNYAKGHKNIGSWRVNKSKENIIRDGQDWWWCPKHNTEGKFDGMHIIHTANKHDDWDEKNQSKR